MKIIVDSTSDISMEEAKELNIDIVPLKVIINGKEYKDRVDLQPDEFYQLLVSSETLPTTSQPTPHEFEEFYQEAKKNNEDVIVFTLSSFISGTYQSAHIAKELAEYDRIHIIDSFTTAQALRLLVHKAVRLRNENVDINEMVKQLEDYKKRMRLVAIVDTLEYLCKGGRISRTAATAGTILKFKPIIGFENGELTVYDKARGMNKATKKVIELIHEFGDIDLNEPISVGYTGSDDGLETFENALREEFHFGDTLHGCVGPVVGTHAGPGARLIAYVKK